MASFVRSTDAVDAAEQVELEFSVVAIATLVIDAAGKFATANPPADASNTGVSQKELVEPSPTLTIGIPRFVESIPRFVA